MIVNSDDEYTFEMDEATKKFLNEFDKELTPEEIEQKKQERAKELESKGFLPENEELSETMSSPQELVELNPRQFIIEECIPACQELWSKNIYTFMVSDHLNEGKCWIEIIFDSLSDENKDIFMKLTGDDIIKFSYHRGCVNFGVKYVGIKGQQKLLELAKQFRMQDVPKNQAWISEKEFLMNYCGCYDEYDNPNYKPMLPPWEANIEMDKFSDYMEEYERWELSEESHQKLKKFAPNKANKTILEYVSEHGIVYVEGKVYLSQFHYQKHKKFLHYMNNTNELEEIHHSKK